MSKKRKNIQRANRRQQQKADQRWDHGADGPANRKGLIIEERGEIDPATGRRSNPNRIDGARRLTWLERYAAKGWITPEGLSIGLQLHEAWQRVSVGTSPPWLRERVDSTPRPDHAVAVQIDRRDAYARLWRLVPAEDRHILHVVCCADRSISRVRGVAGGRQRDATRQHLREALDRLAHAS